MNDKETIDGITLGRCKKCNCAETYTSEGLCSDCFDGPSEDELSMFGVDLDPYSKRGRQER